MKKTGFVLLLLHFFCLPLFAELAKITPDVMNYGEIDEGKVITDQIKFINQGPEMIEITKVRPGCGCTFASLNQYKLEPGDTAVIEFNFDSRGFSGNVRKGITVYFTDATLPPFRYTIQANIIRDFDVSPRYIYLNRLTLNPDTTIVQPVTFSNNSREDIEIEKLYTSSDMIHLPDHPFTVKAGSSKQIDVEIIPSRTIQSRQSIEIETSSINKPMLSISVYLFVKESK